VKALLFFSIFVYSTCFSETSYADKGKSSYYLMPLFVQGKVFHFVNPVPSAVYINDKIDLSFIADQLVVSRYRFRLDAPVGIQTAIDKELFNWSAWMENRVTDIIVPRLDIAGRYSLIIEYKTFNTGGIQTFTRSFTVVEKNQEAKASGKKPDIIPDTKAAEPELKIVTTRPRQNVQPVTNKTDIVAAKSKQQSAQITKVPDSGSKNAKIKTGMNVQSPANKAKTPLSAGILKTETKNKQPGPLPAKKQTMIVTKTNHKAIRIRSDLLPIIPVSTSNIKIEPRLKSGILKKAAYLTIISKYPGNPGSALNNDSANAIAVRSETSLPGNTIKLPPVADNFGNSYLHRAILFGQTRFACSLINSGADLNLKNQIGLSPLHLAVIFNNKEVLNALLKKDLEIDIQGNEGYTPLHIASELNHVELARELLRAGARRNIKTRQHLTAEAIARIQGNDEIIRMLNSRGSDTFSIARSMPAMFLLPVDSARQEPKINFILPYDGELAKKRQLNKIIQIISLPVFSISSAATFYFRSNANRSFSLYKNAETRELAYHYYEATNRLDKIVYVTGTISLASLYSFIHSTIRKKDISNKMRKTY
jgi:ankyrin repeat protein